MQMTGKYANLYYGDRFQWGRLLRTIALAAIIFVGGWLLFNRGQIRSVSDAIHLARRQIGVEVQDIAPDYFETVSTSQYAQRRPDPDFYAGPYESGNLYTRDYSRIPVAVNRNAAAVINHQIEPSPFAAGTTIRIASFKVDASVPSGRLELTADICQQFDVVAIQNDSELSIRQLVTELNRRGFDYRYVDRRGTEHKFGIIFNQQTVLLDDQHWYTVNDPENLFLYEPLVAWFRAPQRL